MLVHAVARPALTFDDALVEATRLYEHGQYVSAYRVLEPFGPLREVKGTRARVFCSRLATQLEGERLGALLGLWAWKESPRDPEALLYRALRVLRIRGPLAMLDFRDAHPAHEDAHGERAADLHIASAIALGLLRDFASAERALETAASIAPPSPWWHSERARLLEAQDRPGEALEALDQALAQGRLFRPALQARAMTLLNLSRDDEALAMLAHAAPRLQSPSVWTQLAMIQRELERYDDAEASMFRAIDCAVLMEPDAFGSYAGILSTIAAEKGEPARAVELAQLTGDGFHSRVSRRMADAQQTRRVKLPVKYVRQNHLTCAPATLTSIAGLWSQPADHLEVAEAICYDGTPSHSERRWAEEHGWTTRAFTVTWESAVALLDRGVAFTLATAEVGSAHLQAVIGYDSARRTLLIRDPSTRFLVEFDAETGLERYAVTGPRGMALVPRAHAHLVDGLTLPDAEQYDLLDEAEAALARHDRASASRAVAALETKWPDHRVTILARRTLARYDENPVAGLAAAEAMAARFPDHPLPKLDVLSTLGVLGRKAERIQRLSAITEQGAPDPFFWSALADELASDARERHRAEFLFRRFVRYRPAASNGYVGLAHLAWQDGRRERALSLYRIASALSERDEGCATSYFLAATHLRQRDSALAFLHDRFERFGGSSGYPVRTLFDALWRSDRLSEGFDALDRAIARRPDDVSLLLYAANACRNFGRRDRAAELLERAKGGGPPQQWARAAAALAEVRGDLAEATAHWRKVLDIEPLAVDAHAAVAQRLAETEGVAAALAHLEAVCARFPYHLPLHQLYLSWLSDRDAEAAGRVLDGLVERIPNNPWIHRERALLDSAQRRHEAAAQSLRAAREIDPDSVATLQVSGVLALRSGRTDEAREAFRACVRKDIDATQSIASLLQTCTAAADRQAELAFVYAELQRQVSFGAGVECWYDFAEDATPPERLLEQVVALRSARPDLFEVLVVHVMHLRRMQAHDAARAEAMVGTDRFPLMARAWFERALCARERGDSDDERTSLERAVELAPTWSRARGELATAYGRAGDVARAKQTLRAMLAMEPWDVPTHGRLAELLAANREPEAAIELIEAALRIRPDYGFGWNRLLEWTDQSGTSPRAMALAKQLVKLRPGMAEAWLWYARVHAGTAPLDECLGALDRAVALDPVMDEAWDARAELLATAGRFDEAIAACAPPAYPKGAPMTLRGRAAWIAAARGNLALAVAKMQPVVDEFPSYEWGQSLLHSWRMQLGHYNDAARSAEVRSTLDPRDVQALSQLGDAQRALGRPVEAAQSLEMALRLAPEWESLRERLFDVYLELGKLDDAARALEGTPEDSPFAAARRVQLAARRGSLSEARRHLGAALVQADGTDWPSSTAQAAMRSRGWSKWLREELEALLRRDPVNPGHADAYGRVLPEWLAVSASKVRSLLSTGDAGARVLAGWLAKRADHSQSLLISLLVRLHGEALHADARLWAAVGSALVRLKRFRAAWRWLAGWRGRDGLTADALVQVMLAALATRRFSAAAETATFALTLPADTSRPFHEACAGWFAALDGNAAEARHHLERAASATDALDRLAVHLARACLAVHEKGLDGLDLAYGLIFETTQVYPAWRQSPVANACVQRTTSAIQRRVGGWRGLVFRLKVWTQIEFLAS